VTSEFSACASESVVMLMRLTPRPCALCVCVAEKSARQAIHAKIASKQKELNISVPVARIIISGQLLSHRIAG
jgi:hypothetical protein